MPNDQRKPVIFILTFFSLPYLTETTGKGPCFKEDVSWLMGQDGTGVAPGLDLESKGGDQL